MTIHTKPTPEQEKGFSEAFEKICKKYQCNLKAIPTWVHDSRQDIWAIRFIMQIVSTIPTEDLIEQNPNNPG